MEKHFFEVDTPSGEIFIFLNKIKVISRIDYIVNLSFLTQEAYDQKINEIEKNNPDKILVVINDKSNNDLVKRSYIRVYSENEFKDEQSYFFQ